MKHYGSITDIDGTKVEIVDIICGGSPCQDLSIAGKRVGLSGERSGLFMEQIRITKEQRNECLRQLQSRGADFTIRDIRPRFMVWENVPGAFSSNNGEDFKTVLEEIARIRQDGIVIPRPNGKWAKSGVIMGSDWSIAWRLHDAQYWGVPQRRKRISLVADFGGKSAPEILFERKSLSGDSSESAEKGKDIAKTVRNGIDETSKCISFQERGGKPGGGKGILIQNERTGALSTLNNQSVLYPEKTTGALCASAYNKLGTQEAMNDMFIVQESSAWDGSQVSPTLTANNAGGNQRMPDKNNFNAVVQSMEVFHCTSETEKVQTLKARDYKDPQVIAYGLDRASFNQGVNAKYNFSIEEEKIGCQVAKGPGAVCTSIARRLTPLECERLQGYPDNWTNIGDWVDSKGKKHKGESDSPRYKALGNSIALPFWKWMAERIVNQYNRPTTMASLFDGIGGFPLVFSECGCEPVWASEIEEFPIAVTKIRFPE